MKKMKRITAAAIAVAAIFILALSAGGCVKLSDEEGYEVLRAAYRNTVAKWQDIYQWEESVRVKADADRLGSITNTVVNVHCDVDGDEYVKDSNYAVTINEVFYEEKTDASAKVTTRMTGKNQLTCGAAGGEDALFIAKTEGKQFSANYQSGVKAEALTDSAWFRDKYALTAKIAELGELSAEDMIFQFEHLGEQKGEALRQGLMTKLTFKVSDAYLSAYRAQNGRASVFEGAYVYVEIVNVNIGAGEPDYRMSTLYVYDVESLGAGLSLDYERYTLKISYLGPNIGVPKSTDKVKDDAGVEYHWQSAQLFDGDKLTEGAFYGG